MPLYTFYMAKSAGVNPATGEQLYWAYDLPEGMEKAEWKGDTPVDEEGNALELYRTSDIDKATSSKFYFDGRMPDFYGSVGTEFKIFNIVDVSFLGTYSIGGNIIDGLYNGCMRVSKAGETWHKNQLRRWQKPGDVTDIPRVEIQPKYVSNDHDLIDASYFAIKNITVGFTLPEKWLNKIKSTKLRIYVAMDNIATFTHMDGMDPQYDFRGYTDNAYTPSKTYSIGLNIGF